jgi:hypothetical protein
MLDELQTVVEGWRKKAQTERLLNKQEHGAHNERLACIHQIRGETLRESADAIDKIIQKYL